MKNTVTKSQIERIFRAHFGPILRDHGFIPLDGVKYYYFRVRGDLVDFIAFVVKPQGSRVELFVECWVPELNPEYPIEKFPKELVFQVRCGGGVDKTSIGIGGGSLPTANEYALANSIAEFERRINEVALPYFDEINSREILVKKIMDCLSQDGSDYVNTLQNVAGHELPSPVLDLYKVRPNHSLQGRRPPTASAP